MILGNPSELREAVPAGARLMGLDVGTKTIGLALSDTRRVIATPLETIRRRRFREDMARLSALIDAHGVGGLVIGLPLTLAGAEARAPSRYASSRETCWPCAICRSCCGTSGCRPPRLPER